MRQKKNRKVAKKICLLFVLFFHSNSIRLLLWKWHTHTQERRQPAAFSSIFPFLLFRCFSFWFLLIFDGITNARAVTRGKFMCATHSQPRSKREKSRTAKKNLSNLLYFFCWSFLGALQFQGFRFGWVCYSCISISMLFIVIAFVIATIW